MRRLFWVGLGAAVGVLVVRRLGRAAHAFTPAGISRSLAESVRELGDAVHYFADQVRQGMSEREAQLSRDLGITPDGAPATERPGAVPVDQGRMAVEGRR